MILIDVHAHLDHPYFKNLDEVIQRARNVGVKAIIANGVNPYTNRIVLQLAEKYDIVKAALGAYPTDILGLCDDPYYPRKIQAFDLDKELEFIKENKEKILALGEVGLDFKIVKERHEEQIKNFNKILDLAEEIKKPLIIHSRGAEAKVIELLETRKIKKAVLHFFCGNKKLIKRAEDLGFYFSIPPNIVRLQHLQMLAEIVNINQLLTETDAPYLSPYPGKINEPAFIIETIKKIAEIKSMTLEEVSNNIYMNYQRLFC